MKKFLIQLAFAMGGTTAAMLALSYSILNLFNIDSSPITNHLPELILRVLLMYVGVALFIVLFLKLCLWLKEKYFN
ncbi:hypothetical protein ACWA2C_28190 [Priestia megaterium]